ncbi:MAG: caspase family protein [Chitinophagaceae bacterium]
MLPIGHTASVETAYFSPDGKLVLSASTDETAKLWDVSTGKLLADLKGHTASVNNACFSPDGKKIITASDDSTAKIWDVLNGELLVTLTGHSNSVKKALFSPDSKKIVTASEDYTAKIWDTQTGKLLFDLSNHTSRLNDVIFTRDGKKIVTASEDDTAKIWDVSTGLQLVNLAGHDFGVVSVACSPDGSKIITASKDRSAKIWDVQTGEMLHNLWINSTEPNSAQFSPDGRKVVTALKDSTARVWDVQTGELLFVLNGHELNVETAKFSPDGKKILTASWDETAILWDAETGSPIVKFAGHSGWVNSAEFSTDGKKVVTASLDRTIKIWDAGSGDKIADFKGDTYWVNDAKFSPDGKRIATASVDLLRLWDAQNGQLMKNLKGHVSTVETVDFSPDGKMLASGSGAGDNSVKVWDVMNGKLMSDLIGHTFLVSSVKFSPDSKKLVTASWDTQAIIWDVKTGKPVTSFGDHKEFINSAQFTPDNKQVITASSDNTVKIWDARTGKSLYDLVNQKNNSYSSASISPDGKKAVIVGGTYFHPVELIDMATRKLLLTFSEDVYDVNSASFSPDGKRVITASEDRTAKLWDVETGRLLTQFIGHSLPVNSANFSPACPDDPIGGKKIITSSEDNTVKVWDTETGALKYTFFALKDSLYINQAYNNFYQCPGDAAKLLHYVTKDLKVITFEQLDVKYNRPDKVLEAIGNTDTSLIKSYRKAWEKRIKKLGIDTTAFRDGYSVPEADFANRNEIEYEQKAGTVKLHIKGIDSAYKLDRLNVWVNEAPLFGQRGVSMKQKNSNSLDTTLIIKLSQGENRIETSVTNVNGTESYRMPLQVNYTPAVKQKESTRFIGIGIDQFSQSQYNLQYSAKDIRDLSVKLKEKYGDDIIIDTLFNEQVTASNVKALKQKLLQTNENDKVIIAYSGHGMLSKDFDYYLSTYSVNFDKPEQNGLPYDELENLLDSIPARKKLMLIDACHSGEVDKEDLVTLNTSSDSLIKGFKPVAYKKEGHLGLKNSFELMQSLFVNVGKSTGATIISAAAGTQFALERNDLKNGVFTYSILEAMKTYPTMKISELKTIVCKRVEELTKGLQKPTSRNETIAVDWNVW